MSLLAISMALSICVVSSPEAMVETRSSTMSASHIKSEVIQNDTLELLTIGQRTCLVWVLAAVYSTGSAPARGPIRTIAAEH